MRRAVWIGLAAALAGAAAAIAVGLSRRTPRRPDGGEGLLPIGAQAPDLSGRDQDGRERRLGEERGHALVVYFYPKDGTPGCTEEACAFRDAWDRYTQARVALFGVSGDDERSHADFAKKHKIPFPLIADDDQRWASAFGVTTTFGIASRVSFLVGPDGKVAKVYPDVDPGVHADDVLRDAAALK